jgi:hypothetical protein
MAGTLDNQYHGDGSLGDRVPTSEVAAGYIQGSTTGADRSEIGPYLTRPSIRPCYVRDRGSTETAKP